jgi:hypothetical protein
MLSANTKKIIESGETRTKVKRAGMQQFVILKVRKVNLGQDQFTELYTDRMIDLSELARIAEEIGLPIEAQNGRAFPERKGAKDFISL